MRSKTLWHASGALVGAVALLWSAADARVSTDPLANFTGGSVNLKSAGPLAFGPDGILFVGDSMGAQVVAIDTHDRSVHAAGNVNVHGIDAKIAAMVGVAPDQITINDVKVNPLSRNAYLSVSRGRGPDAMPLIVRVNADSNEISVLSLDNVAHSSVGLTDAPAATPADSAAGNLAPPPAGAPPAGAAGRPPGGFPRMNGRMMTITDMVYLKGNVMVAGASNEEWSSALRSIPFPFQPTAAVGATIQIWHSSHGRYETQAPIRTFVPYEIDGKQYVLAAYTCTPLVKIAFNELEPGAKVHGTTIADLGARNQPLDMVPYRQDGHDYILINNTARGVMKLKADELGMYQPIDSPTVTDIAGVPYKTISELQNVQYLARLDNSSVLILTGKPGTGPAFAPGPPLGPLNLQTVALP